MATMDGSDDATAFLALAEKNIDMTFRPSPVLPGDDVTDVVSRVSKTIRLGQGLMQHGSHVIATKVGVLRYTPPNRYCVESNQKRYIPVVGDTVVGVVEDRGGELFRVNIRGSSMAFLPSLSFEGATKRNKPNLQVGTVVYARVVVANKDMDPELSCIATSGARRDWFTGQATFGELKNGTVLPCSQGLARLLLQPDCRVLLALGGKLPFEVAVGSNGLVYINSGSAEHTVVIYNAILNCEHLDNASTDAMVALLVENMERKRQQVADDTDL